MSQSVSAAAATAGAGGAAADRSTEADQAVTGLTTFLMLKKHGWLM
jgi:hypothetical protein